MERGEIKITGGKVVLSPSSGTVWLTKHEIADLFGCFVSKVGGNISAILKAGLLDESSVYRRRHYENGSFTEFYNLEMIAALAFRIRSRNADLFRRWLMERAVKQPCPRQVPVFVPWPGNSFPN